MLVKGVDFVDDNEVFMLLYQGLKSPPINLLLNDDDKYEESELTDFKNSIFRRTSIKFVSTSGNSN